MSPNGEVRLWVVMPCFENWADTHETLRALARQNHTDFRVLLADDGSPAPPPFSVADFPFATYLRGENSGFAGNCNRGAGAALAHGATHLLFLNNDTDFGPDFIGSWHRVAVESNGAVVSPLIYWHRTPEEIWYSGGPMNLLALFKRHSREFPQVTDVEIVCGCALLIGAPQWRLLGGFDTIYNVYFEDFDLALRARERGLRVYVDPAPELRVWHKVSGSFRGDGVWPQQYHLVASRLLFARRHLSRPNQALVVLLTFVHLSGVLLQNLPRLPAPRLLAAAFLRGLRDPAQPVPPADFEKSGLLAVRNGRVLLCRKKHTTSLLILPGGVREAGETPEQCLRREVAEELAGVTLGRIEWLGVYTSPAAVEGKTVQVDLFAGVLEGEPSAASEIKEIVWFGPGDDPALLAPSLRDVIFPDLRRRGLIP